MGSCGAACAPNAGRMMARATRTTRVRGLGCDGAARSEDSDTIRVACGDSDVRAGGRCVRPRCDGGSYGIRVRSEHYGSVRVLCELFLVRSENLTCLENSAVICFERTTGMDRNE